MDALESLGPPSSESDRAVVDEALKRGRDAETILRGVDETLGAAGVGLELLADYRVEFDGPIDIVNVPAHLGPLRISYTPNEEVLRVLAHPLIVRQRQGIRIAVVFGVATSHGLQNLRSVAPDFDEWWAPRSARLGADVVARYLYKLRSVIAKEGYMRATTARMTYTTGQGRIAVEAPLYFHDAPRDANGDEASCLALVESYVATMGEIVVEAWGHFAPGADSLARPRPIASGTATYEGFPE